jgi:hypothetical protein
MRADDPEIVLGLASELGPGHDVVQLQPVRRTAAAATVDWPAAAPGIARPDTSPNGGGDGWTGSGATMERLRKLVGGERLVVVARRKPPGVGHFHFGRPK